MSARRGSAEHAAQQLHRQPNIRFATITFTQVPVPVEFGPDPSHPTPPTLVSFHTRCSGSAFSPIRADRAQPYFFREIAFNTFTDNLTDIWRAPPRDLQALLRSVAPPARRESRRPHQVRTPGLAFSPAFIRLNSALCVSLALVVRFFVSRARRSACAISRRTACRPAFPRCHSTLETPGAQALLSMACAAPSARPVRTWYGGHADRMSAGTVLSRASGESDMPNPQSHADRMQRIGQGLRAIAVGDPITRRPYAAHRPGSACDCGW
jgi:hypothetical protein